MEGKMMYKVTVYEGACPCTVPSKDAILSLIEDTQVGDKITIEVVEMSQYDFDQLSEWDGP